MKVFNVKLGDPIEDGNYPPRLVFADYRAGNATILMVDNDEEDVYSLIRQVPNIQRQNARRRQREN